MLQSIRKYLLLNIFESFRFVSRQFVRKYSLPEGCQPEQVSSNLSSDGVLLITAPKKPVQPAITDLGRTVPITMK
jgi:crystallin alpha B